MKKIAFFVEGETEYIFVSMLLKEIAGRKNINILADKYSGGGRKQPIRTRTTILESMVNPAAKYTAYIVVSGTDNRVDTDIKDFHENLLQNGAIDEYSAIVGLRDLKGQKPDLTMNSLADLPKMKLATRVIINSCVLKDKIPTSVIIAVYEIEAWFLAEHTHFEKVDSRLTNTLITSTLRFNPCIDDVRIRLEPAKDLHDIYQLGIPPKSYQKKPNQRERTVSLLDYTSIYLDLRYKVRELNDLITKIDEFLT